ncbi:MAG: tetratricopeptide repeat protein [Actinomycetaceae bacterium]|nr:tetratricopeptide repeat protein [Actinomycetaceae bacterium]
MSAHQFGAVELQAQPPVPESSADTTPAAQAAQAASNVVEGEVVVDVTDATFEAAMKRSLALPIIIDLWAPWCGPCKQLGPLLEKIVAAQGGKVQLAKVNVDENPAIAQAFRVQGIPAVFALIGGQPLQLFTGAVPEAQVRQYVEQVVQAAVQSGLTGVLSGAGAVEEATEEPPDPDEQAALDAIDRGEFEEAAEFYRLALKKNPGKTSLEQALAQTEFLARTSSSTPKNIAEGADPTNVEANLAAADAQLQAGDNLGALQRLLAVIAATEGDEREEVRARLLEYFQILGSDPAVGQARRQLATLLN